MAIPKLALIPSGYKAGKLYSVLPTNGDGDFTTTRNTVATRVNENGLIEEVGVNVPRLDYSDGGCPSLLLEPSATNLVTYSEDFSQWATNGTITPNSAISPDGTQNATLFSHSGGSFPQVIISGITFVSGANYIPSLYVKSDGTSQVQHSLLVDNVVVNFTPTDKWVRISDLIVSTATSGSFIIAQNSASSVPASFYIYGAQLEEQSYATSYIKTVGTIQSRSADTANGAGNASTFNSSEGVLMYQIKPIGSDGIHKRITLSDSTSTNRIIMGFDNNNNVTAAVFNGSNQAVLGGNYIGKDEMSKYALKYKASDFALWLNGFEVDSETSGGVTYPIGTLNQFRFEDGNGGLDFYGSAKQIQYFDSALNDSDLEKLTSWTSFTAMANGQSYTII